MAPPLTPPVGVDRITTKRTTFRKQNPEREESRVPLLLLRRQQNLRGAAAAVQEEREEKKGCSGSAPSSCAEEGNRHIAD